MAGNKLGFFLFCIFCWIIYHVNARSTLYTLSEDDWHQMLQGEWMVEFYAPWCPACKALQPVWDDFSKWSADLNINVAKVDVTTAPGLSGRFMVTALPTIFHVLNGDFRQYRGGRDKDSLISFIEEQKWKDIEAVPSWKSPGSFIMSIVSYFFKLSTVLRSLHNKMVEEFGIPTWGSYVVFGVGTILVGAILGLILVCFIDCLYPPKSQRDASLAPVDETEEEVDIEDLVDEGAESANESQPDTQSEAEEELEGEASQSEQESQNKAEEEGLSPAMRKRRPRKAD